MGLFQICAENSVGNKGIFVISEQHLQRVKAFLAYPRGKRQETQVETQEENAKKSSNT